MSKEDNVLMRWIRDHPYVGPFVPKPHVVWDGDALRHHAKDVDCYQVQVDAYLWLYLSMEDHSVVGAMIHGLKEAKGE